MPIGAHAWGIWSDKIWGPIYFRGAHSTPAMDAAGLSQHSSERKLIRNLLRLVILSVFILGNFFNLQSGWADNGDYTRIMTWITTGPSDQGSNWPENSRKAFELRFFKYWIPNWKLKLHYESNIFISTLLLWAPGVALNRVFYSAQTLHMPILSLGPRLALLVFLYLTLLWIDRRSRLPELHYLTLGLPLALLFSTTDVAAYYNTFTRKPARLSSYPIFLASSRSGKA